ncbi:Flagellar hook-associated protein 2 [compost metagenome]
MGIGISGLASGFNSTEYIEAVIKQESVPLTNLQNKVEITDAYRKFFNNMKTQLNTLKDAIQALGDVKAFKSSAATSSSPSILSSVASDGAIAGDYLVDVKNLAKPQVSASKTFSTSGNFTGTGTLTITRNGTTTDLVDLDELDVNGKPVDEALATIANKINSLEDAGVKASVIQTEPGVKTLVLTATKAGEENSFTLGGDDASFWQSANIQDALNAKIEVNGLTVISSTNEIKDAISGVTLNLTAVGTSTVKVSQDTTGIANKIDTFVKAYNDIITTIRTNTGKSEKNSDGSLSLTLMGDPLLRDLQSQMNSWMNHIVGDQKGFKLLSDIGLEVDKGVTSAAMMTGKISFDKDLFAKKLAENPKAVEAMFNNNVIDSRDADNNPIQISFTQFITDNLKRYTDSVDGVMTAKIKGYDSEISYVNEQITSMKARIAQREENLKKQYVNLEVIMSQLNSQKTWISSQFAALTKSSDK